MPPGFVIVPSRPLGFLGLPTTRDARHSFGLPARLGKRHRPSRNGHPPGQDQVQNDDPEYSLSRKETLQALTQALRALSPEHRSVIELAFIEGFSYREIADIVECPINTVKTRMFHARKRLEQHLATLDVHLHQEERS